MKKIATLLALLICGLSNAQIIDFPDPNFKNALLNYSPPVDTNGDGEISVSEAASPDRLRFEEASMSISDFTGLEFFTNLTILEIRDQLMTDLVLPPLDDVTLLRVSINDNLETLDASQVQVVSDQISINSNFNLSSIDFSSMTSAGLVLISGNTSLDELLMPSLISGRSLFISSNTELATLSAPNLQNLELGMTTGGNTSLNTIAFPNLEIIGGSVVISQQLVLSSVDFTSLTYIGGNLELDEIGISALEFPALVNVYGIEVLDTQIGTLDFPVLNSMLDETITNRKIDLSNNDLLTRFSTPELTEIGSEIYMQTNNLLSTVDFSSLQIIDGDFFIRQAVIPALDLSALQDLNGNFRFLGVPGGSTLNLGQLGDMSTYDIWIERVNEINLINLTAVELLRIDFSDLDNFDLSSLTYVDNMNINNNGINSIDLSSLTTAGTIGLSENDLISVDLSALAGNCGSIALQDNPLETIQFGEQLQSVSTIRVQNTNLDILDLTGFRVITLFADNSTISELYIKNGEQESNISLVGCSELIYVCADESELQEVFDLIETTGLVDVTVSSYCFFTPGGDYYTINGHILFDFDSEGCAEPDAPVIFEAVEISSASGTDIAFTNSEGYYAFYPVEDGVYTVTPLLEYEPLFFTAPPSFTVTIPDDIPDMDVPYQSDFCVSPNGLVDDVGVWILPAEAARPGFDVSYDLVFQNFGNTRVDGQVSFNYAEGILDLISTSETPSVVDDGFLVFDYVSLDPFERRVVEIVLNVNSPSETPPVNNGDILTYSAEILPNPDENPEDNTFVLDQVAVGSFDPNDKTCLQGETITPEEVGAFVDYLIRFENTGTAEAVNIVVTDTINTEYFDLESLRVVGGSHDFVTRVDNNFVEFIFEDINLPFDDANNDGYVLFSIRTLETLELGDSFSNKASIYFDFNLPIITNDAITLIEKPLSVVDFTVDGFTLYPNPASETLNIAGLNSAEITAIEVYNLQGQLLINQLDNTKTVDVSSLRSGVYFIKIISPEGSVFKRFLKN